MADGCRMAYGLDASGGRVLLVRHARRGGGEVRLDAAADAEEAVRALRAVSREVQRGEAVLAVAAPAVQTVVRRLRAPFASLRKAARVWPSLLDVELPFPVEGAVCHFGAPQAENGGTVTVAAALRASDLAAFDAACLAAGIDATHCDAEALALWDQFSVEVPPARADASRALVWLGADHTLIVRGRGKTLLAVHVLRATALGSAGSSFDVLWASRMRPILSVHAGETGGADLAVWWAGPGAEEESRVVRLRQALPAEQALRHEILRQPGSFLARALARRALEGTGANFKAGDRAHPAWVRALARRRISSCLGLAALAVLVLGLNTAEFRLRRQHREQVQRELTAAAEALVGAGVPRGLESLMAERALPERDTATQAVRTAMDPVGMEGHWTGWLGEFAALGIEIARMSMMPATVSVEGTAPGIQAIEGLAGRLQAQGWRVQSESPGVTAEGRTRFILKGTVGHEG